MDNELFYLRRQVRVAEELTLQLEGKVSILEKLLLSEQTKYFLLNDRFVEKQKYLDLIIEEKNTLKYRRKWAGFGAGSSFLSTALLVGLVGAAVK